MEGRNEVNDGRKACIDQKLCPPLPGKRKKVKGEVLREFTQMTGYNRCYGAYLLRHEGKRIRLSPTQAGNSVRRQSIEFDNHRKSTKNLTIAENSLSLLRNQCKGPYRTPASLDYL